MAKQAKGGKAPAMTIAQAEAEMAKHKAAYLAYVEARVSGVPREENPHRDGYSAFKRAYAAKLKRKKAAKGRSRA